MYCSNTLKMGKGCDCRLMKLFGKFVLLVKQKMGIFLVKIVGFFKFLQVLTRYKHS